MAEINLLSSLPKSKKNVAARADAKTDDHIRISREYGEMYFDGPREYGYGGFKYDGRWKSVAKDIIKHFNLSPGDKLLDIGCAKGFLVKDLVDLKIDAYGLDISEYALLNSMKDVSGRLHKGSAEKLIFPDNSFDAVISINTIHNLVKEDCIKSICEMERVLRKKGNAYIQVDSYLNEKEKKFFEGWVLTAKYHDYPENWIELFKKANYSGDWYWTLV